MREERASWKASAQVLPGKSCSSPHTAAVLLTAGESGQGYRDLGAEKKPVTLSGSAKGSLPKPDQRTLLQREKTRLPALLLPLTPRTLTPAMERERLCSSSARPGPIKEAALSTGSSATCSGPYSSPMVPAPTPGSPVSCVCLRGRSLLSGPGDIFRALCQEIWPLKSLQGQAGPHPTLVSG